jgi:Flp pilus assembly protein TadG
MIRGHKKARTGTILVESAMIYPVLFLLLLAVIMLGMSVFRYQQVAHISREASRWASVHGAMYSSEQNVPPTTPQDVYNNAIAPQAIGMGSDALTYSVTWNLDANGNPDQNPTRTVTVVDTVTGLTKVVPQSNIVTVNVTYQWDTIFGTIPVSCTSVNIIYY